MKKTTHPRPIIFFPYIIALFVVLAVAMLFKEQVSVSNNMSGPTTAPTQPPILVNQGTGFVREAELVNLSSFGTTISLVNEKGILHIFAVRGANQSNLEAGVLDLINGAFVDDSLTIQSTAQTGFVLTKDGVSALFPYPLTVDLSAHRIFVRMPQGLQRVTVFPDTAVKNALNTRKITDIMPKKQILIEQFEGQTVYKITGIKKVRLFGLIPVSIVKNVRVSLDSGIVVQTEESLTNRILDSMAM